eukprot:scaffold1480_cov57-Phaeocystis_antarctica.AAC.2
MTYSVPTVLKPLEKSTWVKSLMSSTMREEPHVFDDAWRDGGVPSTAGGQGGYIAGARGRGGGDSLSVERAELRTQDAQNSMHMACTCTCMHSSSRGFTRSRVVKYQGAFSLVRGYGITNHVSENRVPPDLRTVCTKV